MSDSIGTTLKLKVDKTYLYSNQTLTTKATKPVNGIIKSGEMWMLDAVATQSSGATIFNVHKIADPSITGWVQRNATGSFGNINLLWDVVVVNGMSVRVEEMTIKNTYEKESIQLDFGGARYDDYTMYGAGEFGTDAIQDTITMLNSNMDMIAKVVDDKSTGYSAQSFRSILGMPFQFTSHTDLRIKNAKYGRMFNETILMDMPIATFIPGGPKFLHGSSLTKSDKNAIVNIVNNLEKMTIGKAGDALEHVLVGKNARLYSFISQPAIYQKYANSMIRLMARFSEVGSIKYQGHSLDMMNYVTDQVEIDGGKSVRTLFGNTYAINVFMAPESGSSESVSNQMGQPALASVVNSVSQKSREFDMFTGSVFGVDWTNSSEEETLNLAEYKNGSNFFTQLFSSGAQGGATVKAGGNIMLPDIWQDSSTGGGSHEVKCRLVSPYGSNLSIFWHILRPMGMLLALAMPRQLGPNGYTTPMIIQSFSKGNYNCEMGIVEQLQIQRCGNGELQSFNNLPTEVEVTMSIKNLHPTNSMSRDDTMGLFMNNIGLLDFLASFTGVSLNKPEPLRKIQTVLLPKVTRFTDIPASIKMNVYNATRDVLRSLFRG